MNQRLINGINYQEYQKALITNQKQFWLLYDFKTIDKDKNI